MKRILIIAGEASGDMHGANLVGSMRKKSKDVEFFGLGGHGMQEAGVKLYYNLVDVAVLGLFEVFKKCISFFGKKTIIKLFKGLVSLHYVLTEICKTSQKKKYSSYLLYKPADLGVGQEQNRAYKKTSR